LGPLVRRRLTVHGIVQGVGFRPTVHRLALRHRLSGRVLNFAGGVVIEVEGTAQAVAAFATDLEREKPPIALIEDIRTEDLAPTGETGFVIAGSERGAGAEAGPILVSPDVAVCADCERELYDPADRRYGHPFINCTNCGPRFTIIRGMPYDRPLTSMAAFPMCDRCRAEYEDITNRRYHAQPVACPDCGPRLSFVYADGSADDDPLGAARRLLAEGRIVAAKGLGGFHLACDARNEAAVQRLRERKHREEKPLAVMSHCLETIREYAVIPEWSESLLTGARKPIVLLPKRHDADARPLAPSVAPDSASVGVLLPYTPLHHLLFRPAVGRGLRPAPEVEDPSLSPRRTGIPARPSASAPLSLPEGEGRGEGGLAPLSFRRGAGGEASAPLTLVMTSGNLSDEPLATDNNEARARLAGIADGFLLHDRDIYIGCDDSVVRPTPVGTIVMRRARSYAPFPLRLPRHEPPVLALGAHLKSTFCLLSRNYAYVSQHLGDLEDAPTLGYLQRSLAHFERLLEMRPEVLACDLHPDYLSSQFAEQLACDRGLPLVRVQHHHAHIASTLAERRQEGPVVGLACDGVGLGADGHIWGCEVLVADLKGYRRAAHLPYLPLPGGERAVREPWRVAAVLLEAALGPDFAEQLPAEAADLRQRLEAWPLLAQMIATHTNAPLASSAGRLFDAVASLVGLQQEAAYEAQPAMRLEMVANLATDNGPGAPLGPTYPFELRREERCGTEAGHLLLDPVPIIRAIVEELQAGRELPLIAAAFHDTFVRLLADAAEQVAAAEGLREVALGGGTFQNEWVLRKLTVELQRRGLSVHTHDQVPCNDGGLSLGQALVAARRTSA